MAFLTLRDIAERFRCTPETVRQWILRGVPGPSGVVRLRAIRPGHGYLVDPAWLDDFTAARAVNPGPDVLVPVSENSWLAFKNAAARATKGGN